MESSTNRWLICGLWLFALLAMLSGSATGAGGIAALWSLPVALVGTVALMIWPLKRAAITVGALSLVWQIALIGAWWPFTSREDDAQALSPMHWPVQSLVIGGILLVLVLAFFALFLLPGIALCRRVSRAAEIAWEMQADHEERIESALEGDDVALQAWNDYRAQWLRPEEGAAQAGSRTGAREWFDVHGLAHARLRLEFFRNLPGVFTGMGIIGTFTGLILALRRFKISPDPNVIQRSLEALLGGVWEAFLVSALAITLAITVTVIEKTLMSALARRVERWVIGLDILHPPRSEETMPAWLQPILEELTARPNARLALAREAVAPPRHAVATTPSGERNPIVMMPLTGDERGITRAGSYDPLMTDPGRVDVDRQVQDAAAGPAAAAGWQVVEPVLKDLAAAAQASAQVVKDIALQLPALLAEQQKATQQAQQQSAQMLKSVTARMEGLASSIEVGGRRTMENVATRLMQAQMEMTARHHVVTEQMGEIVQRIETLCGLLQQDRALPLEEQRFAATQQPSWDLSGLGGHAAAPLGEAKPYANGYGRGASENGQESYGQGNGQAYGQGWRGGGGSPFAQREPPESFGYDDVWGLGSNQGEGGGFGS